MIEKILLTKILMKKFLMKKIKCRMCLFLYLNNYNQKCKERLGKKPRKKYWNFSKEEKEKRRKKIRERFWNLSAEQKPKLIECTRKYCITHKKVTLQSHNKIFFIILGQLNFLFQGLVFEIWENCEIFYEFKDFLTIKHFFEFY